MSSRTRTRLTSHVIPNADPPHFTCHPERGPEGAAEGSAPTEGAPSQRRIPSLASARDRPSPDLLGMTRRVGRSALRCSWPENRAFLRRIYLRSLHKTLTWCVVVQPLRREGREVRDLVARLGALGVFAVQTPSAHRGQGHHHGVRVEKWAAGSARAAPLRLCAFAFPPSRALAGSRLSGCGRQTRWSFAPLRFVPLTNVTRGLCRRALTAVSTAPRPRRAPPPAREPARGSGRGAPTGP